MLVPSFVRRYEGTFDQLLLLSFRTWGYISLSDIFGTFSKIGRNNFEGTFAGNGKMRVLFCADKNTAAQFLRECARVRVRARMRKYTDFQKAGLLNNYVTPACT